MKKVVRGLFLCVALYLIMPRQAYCYIDLGTGSYMLQILFGTVLGIIFSIKVFWGKIKTSIKKIFRGKSL